MDRDTRLKVVVELLQFGFKSAAESIGQSFEDCHPEERHLLVNVMNWFEKQSGVTNLYTAELIESGRDT